ncbi:hypothetical protein OH77DRAFT_1517593 [Trametes cingulata]|nr:hypothetical protein OH77DRAFT_1517593 [Trametes cingulata]
MSPADRPRRASANPHPAEPLLKLKIPRRSAAEVAQERAAVEAERQAILKRREEDLKALAELEAKLKKQDEEAQKFAARPPPQNAFAKRANSARTSASNRSSKPPSRPSSCTAAEPRSTEGLNDEAPASTATIGIQNDSTSRVPKGSLGRLKKSTRADLEAYRVGLQDNASREERENAQPQQVGVDRPSTTTAASTAPGGRKRKASQGATDAHGEPTPPRPAAKKGKSAIPAGLTASAADRLASRRSDSMSSSSATSNPNSDLSSTAPLQASQSSFTTTPSSSSTPPSHDPSTPQVNVHPGGYLDDETPEQLQDDRAELASPQSPRVKEPVHSRRTDQGVVQMEVVDVSRASASPTVGGIGSEPSAGIKAGHRPPFHPAHGLLSKRSGNWQMKDLDNVLGPYVGRFGAQFIPRLIEYVGNLACGPWQLYGVNLPKAMEEIARDVWSELREFTVEVRQPFYELAKQKLSDYRNDVAAKAVDVVFDFMQSRRFRNSPESRREWVAWALSDEERYPFRYAKVIATDDGWKRSGFYQGKLVVKTLSYHVKRIQKRADQIRDHPCNALALATTAVERALKMWETGEYRPPKPRSDESKFSDKLWGRTAQEYMGSIINLSDEQWEKILKLAELHLRGLITDSEDEDTSDDEHGDYNPADLPTTGGRASWDSDCDGDETVEPMEVEVEH